MRAGPLLMWPEQRTGRRRRTAHIEAKVSDGKRFSSQHQIIDSQGRPGGNPRVFAEEGEKPLLCVGKNQTK